MPKYIHLWKYAFLLTTLKLSFISSSSREISIRLPGKPCKICGTRIGLGNRNFAKNIHLYFPRHSAFHKYCIFTHIAFVEQTVGPEQFPVPRDTQTQYRKETEKCMCALALLLNYSLLFKAWTSDNDRVMNEKVAKKKKKNWT